MRAPLRRRGPWASPAGNRGSERRYCGPSEPEPPGGGAAPLRGSSARSHKEGGWASWLGRLYLMLMEAYQDGRQADDQVRKQFVPDISKKRKDQKEDENRSNGLDQPSEAKRRHLNGQAPGKRKIPPGAPEEQHVGDKQEKAPFHQGQEIGVMLSRGPSVLVMHHADPAEIADPDTGDRVVPKHPQANREDLQAGSNGPCPLFPLLGREEVGDPVQIWLRKVRPAREFQQRFPCPVLRVGDCVEIALEDEDCGDARDDHKEKEEGDQHPATYTHPGDENRRQDEEADQTAPGCAKKDGDDKKRDGRPPTYDHSARPILLHAVCNQRDSH